MMNRSFTKREETLLVILAVILLVVGYVKLYLEPLNQEIDMLESKTLNEQTEIDTNNVPKVQIAKMEKEISEIKGSGDYKAIPEYDNGHAVTKELYSILEETENYSLSFGDTVRNEYIVARPVSLEYETETYAQARAIIDELNDSEYVVVLGNISIQQLSGKNVNNEVGFITRMDITYYEAVYS